MAARKAVRSPCGDCAEKLRALDARNRELAAEVIQLRTALGLEDDLDGIPKTIPTGPAQILEASRAQAVDVGQLAGDRPVRPTLNPVLYPFGRVLYDEVEAGASGQRESGGPVFRPSNRRTRPRGPLDRT